MVVLHNLAALHPLGDPTTLMEFLAEQEPRNPRNGTIVPIVLLVPGASSPRSTPAIRTLRPCSVGATPYRYLHHSLVESI